MGIGRIDGFLSFGVSKCGCSIAPVDRKSILISLKGLTYTYVAVKLIAIKLKFSSTNKTFLDVAVYFPNNEFASNLIVIEAEFD